jgi:hypothetical protein
MSLCGLQEVLVGLQGRGFWLLLLLGAAQSCCCCSRDRSGATEPLSVAAAAVRGGWGLPAGCCTFVRFVAVAFEQGGGQLPQQAQHNWHDECSYEQVFVVVISEVPSRWCVCLRVEASGSCCLLQVGQQAQHGMSQHTRSRQLAARAACRDLADKKHDLTGRLAAPSTLCSCPPRSRTKSSREGCNDYQGTGIR